LKTTQWPEGTSHGTVGVDDELWQSTQKAKEGFIDALKNDLNTAEARAAIFDLVRFVNARADAGVLTQKNVRAVLDVLSDFDKVFAVLENNDAQWTRFALEWAEREGRLHEASPEVLAQLSLSDAQIEALIEERNHARRTRNFARADAIRKELLEKGVLLEDSKEGVRWKRK
jgi:cysteinyl-tRNA synthetase